MAVAYWMIGRLDNMVCRTVHRGEHVAQLVKHGQVVEGGVAASVIEVAKKGCTGHRNENRVTAAQLNVFDRIAGMIGEFGRDRTDEVTHKAAVKIDAFADDFRPGLFPVRQCDPVSEYDAHVFENIHRRIVDSLDFVVSRTSQ